MSVKISKIIKKFWKTEGNMELKTPKGQGYSFELHYGKLLIGRLTLSKDGLWKFAYSTKFKEQDRIKPISEFPDKGKEYRSKELFPFFVHRIPSTSQPEVIETIEKEQIDKDNEVALLRRFGEFSISNPFRLTAG